MNRATLGFAILAFVFVAAASPVQVLGGLIAPLLVLVLAAIAGWLAAQPGDSSPATRGAKAGAWVGLGALLGSVVGLAVLALTIGSLPGVAEMVNLSEPHPEARIPVGMVAPLAAAAGALGGLFLGLVDLLVAAASGAIAAAVHGRRPAEA